MGVNKLNLFNCVGGKFYMIDRIVPLLDYNKRTYIELFGGSGKVILNKPSHKVEIYNDYNKDFYNLFKTVKENFDEFMEELRQIPVMEEIYYDFRDNKYDCITPVQRAVRTYYLFNLGFSGKPTAIGVSFDRNAATSYWNKSKILQQIASRLSDVYILNKDYKDILDSVKKSKNVMLYADPPYFDKEKYYAVQFTLDDHKKLAEYLNAAKYKVLLSYYEFDGIKDLYPQDKWTYFKRAVPKFSYGLTKFSKKTVRQIEEELLIANYKPDNMQLKLFKKNIN